MKLVTRKSEDRTVNAAAGQVAPREEGRYRIIRSYADARDKEIIHTGLTRAEAQEHCNRDDAKGPGWFDGFTKE